MTTLKDYCDLKHDDLDELRELITDTLKQLYEIKGLSDAELKMPKLKLEAILYHDIIAIKTRREMNAINRISKEGVDNGKR